MGADTPHSLRWPATGRCAPLEHITACGDLLGAVDVLDRNAAARHGVVANGWYFRDLAEVMFWRQSNALVHGEKVWDTARRRDARCTCAKLFWWFNMYSTADWSATPRPIYPADGRKIADVYTHPAELKRRAERRSSGRSRCSTSGARRPTSRSSAWIAEAGARVGAGFRRRFGSFICPISITTCNGSAPAIRRYAKTSGRLTRFAGR